MSVGRQPLDKFSVLEKAVTVLVELIENEVCLTGCQCGERRQQVLQLGCGQLPIPVGVRGREDLPHQRGIGIRVGHRLCEDAERRGCSLRLERKLEPERLRKARGENGRSSGKAGLQIYGYLRAFWPEYFWRHEAAETGVRG